MMKPKPSGHLEECRRSMGEKDILDGTTKPTPIVGFWHFDEKIDPK
jgi:hypothetical protein